MALAIVPQQIQWQVIFQTLSGKNIHVPFSFLASDPPQSILHKLERALKDKLSLPKRMFYTTTLQQYTVDLAFLSPMTPLNPNLDLQQLVILARQRDAVLTAGINKFRVLASISNFQFTNHYAGLAIADGVARPQMVCLVHLATNPKTLGLARLAFTIGVAFVSIAVGGCVN